MRERVFSEHDHSDAFERFQSLKKEINILIHDSNYRESIEKINSFIESSGFNDFCKSEIYLLKAKIQIYLRDFTNALESINIAISSEPEDAKLYSYKAEILNYQGMYFEAFASVEQGLEKDSSSFRNLLYKGYILKNLYKNSEAVSAWRKAVKLSSEAESMDIDFLLDKIKLFRGLEDYRAAEDIIITLVDVLPKFSQIHLERAIIDLTRDSKKISVIERVKTDIDNILKLNPNDAVAMYFRGIASEILGEKDKAHKDFLMSHSMSSDYANPVLALARIAIANNNNGLAIEYTDYFLENFPNATDILFEKFRALTSDGKFAEAKIIIDKLVDLNPIDYYYHYKKAYIYSCLDQYEKALEECELSLKYKPDHLKSTYFKAVINIALKNYDQAFEQLNDIIGKQPYFALSYQGIGQLISEIINLDDSFGFYYKNIAKGKDEFILSLIRDNKISDAEIAYYNNVTAENYKSIELYKSALSKIASGDIRAAVIDMELIVEENPNFALAYLKLSEMYLGLSDRDKSEENFIRAIKANKEYIESIKMNKELPYLISMEEIAINSHDKAIELDPNNPIFYSSKARSLSKFNKFEEVIKASERAQSLIEEGYGKTLITEQIEHISAQNEVRMKLLKAVSALVKSAKLLDLNVNYAKTFETIAASKIANFHDTPFEPELFMDSSVSYDLTPREVRRIDHIEKMKYFSVTSSLSGVLGAKLEPKTSVLTAELEDDLASARDETSLVLHQKPEVKKLSYDEIVEKHGIPSLVLTEDKVFFLPESVNVKSKDDLEKFIKESENFTKAKLTFTKTGEVLYFYSCKDIKFNSGIVSLGDTTLSYQSDDIVFEIISDEGHDSKFSLKQEVDRSSFAGAGAGSGASYSESEGAGKLSSITCSSVDFSMLEVEEKKDLEREDVSSKKNKSKLLSDAVKFIIKTKISKKLESDSIRSLHKTEKLIEKSLEAASSKNSSTHEMMALLKMIESMQKDIVSLQSQLKEFVTKKEVAFAIRHDEEYRVQEDMLKEIESNPALMDYYNAFIRTLEQYYIGALSSESGLLSKHEVSIPGLKYIPLPPVISHVIKFSEKIWQKVDSIKTTNEIRSTLLTKAGTLDMFKVFSKVGAKLSTEFKEYVLDVEGEKFSKIQKIVKFFKDIKDTIIVDSYPTPYAKLGFSDACLVLSGLKQGLFVSDSLTDDKKLVEEIFQFIIDPETFYSAKSIDETVSSASIPESKEEEKAPDQEDASITSHSEDGLFNFESAKEVVASSKKPCCVIMKAGIHYDRKILNYNELSRIIIENNPSMLSVLLDSDEMSELFIEIFEERGVEGVTALMDII